MADPIDDDIQERTVGTLKRLYESYPAKIEAMMLNRTLKRDEQKAELARLKEEQEALSVALDMLEPDSE